MKRIAIALALALSPIAGASACATYDQVAKPTRQYLSDAEALWLGTAQIAEAMYKAQMITPEQFAGVYATLAETSRALDIAHALLNAGDGINAGKSAASILVSLSALAYDLAVIRDNPPSAPPAPVLTQFPVSKV